MKQKARPALLTVAAALVVGLVGALTGCGSAGSSSLSTLTIAVTNAPTSLDPSVNINGGFVSYYETLAYQSLIERGPDGEYLPGLATEWGYVRGKEGSEYRLTLREGAKFSDGTPVTAEAVAGSINYFVASGKGPTASAYSGLSAEAKGQHTVLLKSATPNPIITDLLTPANYGGAIISPAGVADSARLTNATFGAGPYVYQPAQSVSGDRYVYTPNEHYYDQSRIRFEKVVLKVMGDTSSAFQAVRSGQAQAMSGTADLVASARDSGLTVKTRPAGWNGVFLIDFGGNLTPALGDKRVRQALNHALDRDAIARAVYGPLGEGTSQPNTPGSDGYAEDLADAYSYDPARAKSLLREAGYADGFELSLPYPSYQGDNAKVMQAVADQLSNIGVKVRLRGAKTSSAIFDDLLSKKYSVLSVNWGNMPEYLLVNQVFGPAAPLNPWQHVVPGLAELVEAYAASPEASRQEAAREVQRFLVDEALSVPVAQYALVYFASSDVQGFELDPTGTPNNPADWSLAG